MSRKAIAGIVVLVTAVIVTGFFVLTKPSQPAKTQPVRPSLASLSTSPAPWPPEYVHLHDRLGAIYMPLLGAEGTAQHIHAHLDIFVEGHRVTVPAEIGIPPGGGITPIHTHDTSGIIHIESPDAHAKYSLGEFFDVWGVKLAAERIGGYANNSTDTLSVYDNGTLVTDPVNLALAAHHEVVIVYGTAAQKTALPSSYNFPSGL